MDGIVCGLTRTSQSSQNETHPRENLGPVPATQFAGHSAKGKCRAPWSKIIKNFKMATAEHETKRGTLLSKGVCVTAWPAGP